MATNGSAVHTAMCPCVICTTSRTHAVIVIEDHVPVVPVAAAPAVLPTLPLPPVTSPVVPTPAVCAVHLGREEEKHWSKAMAAVLRYSDVARSANRTMEVQVLLATVRTSRRYGSLSYEVASWIVMRSNRFTHYWETDPTTGWAAEKMHAI